LPHKKQRQKGNVASEEKNVETVVEGGGDVDGTSEYGNTEGDHREAVEAVSEGRETGKREDP